MAKAAGSIAFAGLPNQYTIITINDGQSAAYSTLKLGVQVNDSSVSNVFLSGALGGASNNTVEGNASNLVTVYQAGNTTRRPFFDFSISAYGTSFSDFRSAFKDGGTHAAKFQFKQPGFGGLTIDFVDVSSGFTATSGLGSYGRKNGTGDYTINLNSITNLTNTLNTMKSILTAANTAGEMDLYTSQLTVSSGYLRVMDDRATSAANVLSLALIPADGETWTEVPAGVAAFTVSSNRASTKIADVRAANEVVYAARGASGESSSTLTKEQFATYIGALINNLPIQIGATVSGATVSLENEVDGSAGNVTITTTDSTNITLSGMAGGGSSAGGSIGMAKRLQISAAQMALSSSGGLSGSDDPKSALMLSYTGLAGVSAAGDDDLLALHVDGQLVPKKIKISELIGSIAAGSDTQVQFNDGGAFGGNSALVFNKNANALTASNFSASLGQFAQLHVHANSIKIGDTVLSESDLEQVDGLTAGTVAASKAVVVDSNKDITGFRNVTATGYFEIGSAQLTEAEMEQLDGITAGTAAASKAVVLDSNKDVSGLRNASGAIFSGSGVSTLHKLTADAITADGAITAGSSFIIGSADLNEADMEKLDGITDGTAAANKAVVVDANKDVSGLRNVSAAVLSGSGTSTLHKLNADAVTATGAITAGSSFIIGSADLNEADMEKLDGITNGTVAASKAVVVDANKDASGFRHVTATGAVTAGTSLIIGSADMNEADLEKLDGITAGTAAASKALVLDSAGRIGTITQLTASYAKITELDVVTLNSVSQTETTLEIQDKLIVSALSASSANADGGGLKIGGGQEAVGHASVEYSHSGTKMLHKLGATTIASVKPTGVDVVGQLSGSGLVVAASASFDGAVTAGTSFIIGSADLNEADMEKLDGITNGTVAASKAVVVDANKDASGFRNVTATGAFIIGDANLNEADMEQLDGITAGTVAASKAVVVDSNKDASGFRHVTATGALTAGTSIIIGSADLNEADLEKLDGITDGTAAASKALVLDSNKDASGVRNLSAAVLSGSGQSTLHDVALDKATIAGTANAAIFSGSGVSTLHKLTADAVTVDGAVTAGSFVIGSADISEAELEQIDGITAGTVAASKAVVVDANKDASGFRHVTATGALTAGTSLIIGSADLNEADMEQIDGITAGTVAASKAVVVDSNKDASGFRILSGSGTSTLHGLTSDTVSVGSSFSLGGTAFAATAVELNTIADVSAGGDHVAAVDVSADHFLFRDGGNTGAHKVESFADLATAQAGAGLLATNGVFSIVSKQDRGIATASFDGDGSATYGFLPLSAAPADDACVSVYLNGLLQSQSSSLSGITDHWDYKYSNQRIIWSPGTDVAVGDEIVIKYIAQS